MTLKGIKRSLGNHVQRKSPMTPAILRQIHGVINFNNALDTAIWAASLIAFYGLLRKSNLMPDSLGGFDASRQLTRSDFTFFQDRIDARIKWSKTVQYGQRIRTIPFPRIPGNPLCPVSAVMRHFELTATLRPLDPAFAVTSSPPTPLTASVFIHYLKSVLSKLGYAESLYSSHSFRRGGASFALSCGVSQDDIRILGDWASNAYMSYLCQDTQSLFKIMLKMSRLV